MALLNYIIPDQGFEVVGGLIVSILRTEFANQEVLSADSNINPEVFLERFVSIGKEKIPAINVTTSRGNITTNTTVSRNGDYNWFIDVYAKAKSSDGVRADELASKRLKKMIGRIMVILEDPQYRVLGIEQPAGIGRTFIADIAIADPTEVDEATSSIMGRLTFTVNITDVPQLLGANAINGYQTESQIDDTGKGHEFTEEPTV